MTVEFIPIAEFVLKIFSALTNLATSHRTQKKEFLENHIEPLQDRLMRIHQDYVAGFQEARRLIKDGSKPTDEILEFLLERRREYDSQRQLSHHLAIEIEKAKKLPIDKKLLKAISNYCNSIVEYLYAGTDIAAISWYTDFIDNVRVLSRLKDQNVWRRAGISGNPRDDLFHILDRILNKRLPAAFNDVLAKYAVLRTQLL